MMKIGALCVSRMSRRRLRELEAQNRVLSNHAENLKSHLERMTVLLESIVDTMEAGDGYRNTADENSIG